MADMELTEAHKWAGQMVKNLKPFLHAQEVLAAALSAERAAVTTKASVAKYAQDVETARVETEGMINELAGMSDKAKADYAKLLYAQENSLQHAKTDMGAQLEKVREAIAASNKELADAKDRGKSTVASIHRDIEAAKMECEKERKDMEIGRKSLMDEITRLEGARAKLKADLSRVLA